MSDGRDGHTAGTRYFFLSMVGISLFSAFSQITGILSGYFCLIRSASALRLSVGLIDKHGKRPEGDRSGGGQE